MNIDELMDQELGKQNPQARAKPSVNEIIDQELPEQQPMPDFNKIAEAMLSGVKKKAPRQ